MATPFDQNMTIGGQNYGNTSSSTASLVESWKKLKHPWVSLAHVVCRVLPIIFYVFSNLLQTGFIIQMNISGRLLVGLRWWAQTDDEGKTKWVYEQAENMSLYDPMEGKLFWGVLFLAPIIWGFFVIVDFFTFKWVWMILAGMGFVMTSINAYGYIKCRWNSTSEITNYFSKMAMLSLLRRNVQQPTQQKPTEIV